MKSKASTRLLIISFICGSSAVFAEEVKHLPMETWVTAQTAVLEKVCAQQTLLHERASLALNDTKAPTSSEHDDTKYGMEFSCDCAPKAFRAYSNTLSADDQTRIVTQEKFQAIVVPLFINQCEAAHIRSRVDASCMGGKFTLPAGVTNRAVFCECISMRLKFTPDNVISNEATAAKAMLEDAKLQLEGRVIPTPSKRDSLPDQLLRACSGEAK